jgi:hypothetical protein
MSLVEYDKNVIETLNRNPNFTITESNSTILSGNPGYAYIELHFIPKTENLRVLFWRRKFLIRLG